MRVYAPGGTATPLLGRNPKTLGIVYDAGNFNLNADPLVGMDYTVPVARAAQFTAYLFARVSTALAATERGEIHLIITPSGGVDDVLILKEWIGAGLDAEPSIAYPVSVILQAGDRARYRSVWTPAPAGKIGLNGAMFGVEYDA